MSTPALQLQTLYTLDGRGRITGTREPGATPGPLFTLIRGPRQCAWAVRADVPDEVASKLDALARTEPPIADLEAAPIHAAAYRSLLTAPAGKGGQAMSQPSVYSGPAFKFPEEIAPPAGVRLVEDEALLQRHFKGWVAGEIAGGRLPVMAVWVAGSPVSVCFCARRTEVAAEAGLDTAAAFRGRGYGPRVTAAWARAIRAEGLIPLYSTAWSNHASRAVARKLGLIAYASDWSLPG